MCSLFLVSLNRMSPFCSRQKVFLDYFGGKSDTTEAADVNILLVGFDPSNEEQILQIMILSSNSIGYNVNIFQMTFFKC